MPRSLLPCIFWQTPAKCNASILWTSMICCYWVIFCLMWCDHLPWDAVLGILMSYQIIAAHGTGSLLLWVKAGGKQPVDLSTFQGPASRHSLHTVWEQIPCGPMISVTEWYSVLCDENIEHEVLCVWAFAWYLCRLFNVCRFSVYKPTI